MTDLEYILSAPLDLMNKYLDALPQSKADEVMLHLKKWREGKDKPIPSHVKMIAAGLRRLEKTEQKPKPATPPIPITEKKVDLVEAEKEMIVRAREDLATFIHYVTDKEPAFHHKLWIRAILTHDYTNIIAPPGSAKTTTVQAFLAFILGQSPLLTNSIISVSDAQAQARLTGIKSVIEHNERFRNVFPHIQIDDRRTNNMNMFSVLDDRMNYSTWMTYIQQKGHPNDPSLFAAGFGNSGIIGKRWSGYCCIDDMVDQTMLTAAQMDQADDFVKLTLMSRLVPNMGRMVNIGTRWMIGDLIQKLQANSEWYTIEMAAIYYDEESKPHSYWPEIWDLDTLERKRKSMMKEDGSDFKFRLMYLNDTTATTAGLFNQDVLSVDLPEGFRPKLKWIYITTDWATKVKERNDFTVFQAVGVDAEYNYYLLDQRRIKQGPESSPSALGDFADDIATEYGFVTDIIIEQVGMSAFGPMLRQHRPDLPYREATPKGDKGFRAKLVSNAAHTGRLFINQRMEQLDILKNEWINFGTAKHDDTLDPIGLLIQHLGVNRITAKVHHLKSHLLT